MFRAKEIILMFFCFLPALSFGFLGGCLDKTASWSEVEEGTFEYVDLSGKTNTITKALYPLSPVGSVTLERIPFRTAEQYIAVYRGRPSLGICVGLSNVKYLFFLHTCRGDVPESDFGRYVIRYADGSREEIILTSGRNLAFIGQRCPETRSVTDEGLYGFQIYRWENPYPDKIIASIDLFVDADNVGLNVQVAGITAVASEGTPNDASKRTIVPLVDQRIKEAKLKGMILSWKPIDRSKHPFLLLSDFKNIRAKARDKSCSKVYQEYKKRADAGETGWMNLLGGQWNALAYIVEDDKTYAIRAKESLIKSCDGLKEAIYKGGGVGAVHVGRALRIITIVYDIIINSGVVSDEEDERLRENIAFMAYKLMDKGYYRWDETGRGGNWNTDRFIGVGMFSLCFPNHPKSGEWRAHALKQFEAQMKTFILSDGSVPESPRYHGGVLRALVPFAYAVKRNTGKNLFENKKFKTILEWLVQIQTPPDPVFGKYIMSGGKVRNYNMGLMGKPSDRVVLVPGLGDANWANWWFATLGWAAPAYVESDPAFSGRLMWTWNRAGQPFAPELSPGNPLSAFILSKPNLKAIPQRLKSHLFSDIDYAILRSRFGREDEACMVFNCGPRRSHQHNDRGSFSLYAYGLPLSLDPGVSDYGPSKKFWYSRPKAHNSVTFGPEQAAGLGGARTLTFLSTKYLDYVAGNVPKPEGVSSYTRHILFVKPDYFVIWDEIKSGIYAEWNFHAPCSEVKRAKNKITLNTEHNVDLDIIFLQDGFTPDNVLLEEDPQKWVSDTEKWFGKSKWIKVKQEPSGDFLTILYPYRKGLGQLELLASSSNHAEIKVGLRVSSLFFGKQKDFNGKVGINVESSGQVIGTYMIDADRITRGEYSIRADKPITASFERQTDSRWLFKNWGAKFARVTMQGLRSRPVIYKIGTKGNRIRQKVNYDPRNRKIQFSVSPKTSYEIVMR